MQFTSTLWLLVVGGTILTAGDLVMKVWTRTNQLSLFVVGILIWIVGNICLGLSFRSQNIAVATVILVIVNVATLTLVSWLYFHEPLSPRAIIGLIIGLIAIVILES